MHAIAGCRYAEPDYEMEEEVEDGELVGSMYGLVENEDEPEEHHQKQHHDEDGYEDEYGKLEEQEDDDEGLCTTPPATSSLYTCITTLLNTLVDVHAPSFL